MGTTTVRFGTLTSWLVDVVNTLTGNLDRPGGVMFPLAAAGQRNASSATPSRPTTLGRFATAERGLGEVFGELPTAALAEEILGGHIRGLITIAGNPALSAANGELLEKALAGLDLLVSVDPYCNETTRHADVVLPVPGPLERPHYDLAFTQLSVRNVAHYSPAVMDPAEADPPMPPEWSTLARLAGALSGMAGVRPEDVDAMVLRTMIGREVAAPGITAARAQRRGRGGRARC